jgi:pimeloyl-ACP methyl ester carboxylesterase
VRVVLFPFRLLVNLVIAIMVFALTAVFLVSAFSAMYLPLQEKVAANATDPDGSWMWIDGHPIHYRTWGQQEDPAVVLVHGHTIEGLAMWDATAPVLAGRGLYVVAVDLIGYGYSARGEMQAYSLRAHTNILAQTLNQLNVRDATVVGHAEGAGVVLQTAVEQPQFVGSMILLSPRIEGLDRPLWREVANIPYIGTGMVWAVDGGGPIWRWQRSRLALNRDRLPAGYIERAGEFTRIIGTVESLRMMAASEPDDNLPEAIPTLRTPALIVVGNSDRAFSAGRAEELLAHFANAELVTVREAGHFPQIDQPELVNGHIVRVAAEDVKVAAGDRLP